MKMLIFLFYFSPFSSLPSSHFFYSHFSFNTNRNILNPKAYKKKIPHLQGFQKTHVFVSYVWKAISYCILLLTISKTKNEKTDWL